MGDEKIDIGETKAVAGEELLALFRHIPHCMLEHDLPLHADEPVGADGVAFFDMFCGPAADGDEITQRAVRRTFHILHHPERARTGRTKDYCSGSIAEEYAGRTIREIGAAAQSFSCDEQDNGVGMELERSAGEFEPVDEACAGGIEIHAHHRTH